MDLTPFLVLPVVGGYAFASIWSASLYTLARESGHRLYFRAVFYAVFLVVCASEVHVILVAHTEWYPRILSAVSEATPFGTNHSSIWGQLSLLVVLVLSLVLGPSLAYLLNFSRLPWFLNRYGIGWPSRLAWLERWLERWEQFLLERAIAKNDLERLVLRSVQRTMPLLLTLKTGKVYAGWAMEAPNPIGERRYIKVLPLMSGYRTSGTHEVEFTNKYGDIISVVQGQSEDEGLAHLSEEDLAVVLPVSDLVSIHFFDAVVYQRFQEHPQENSQSA